MSNKWIRHEKPKIFKRKKVKFKHIKYIGREGTDENKKIRGIETPADLRTDI